MVSFPNAKINLGLYITSKRPDGYHDIASIFYPIPIRDVLEVNTADKDSFHSSGLIIDGDPTSNLVLKALELLRTDFDIPNLSIHLHKNIPMGAGLGGGSADGSFMLLMLNDMFSLELSHIELEAYASKLGSDCAFFIKNQVALATGRGEILEGLDLDLMGYKLLLVNPGIHISTAEAYADVTPATNHPNFKEVITTPLKEWSIRNQFEDSVLVLHPEIGDIKNEMLNRGAKFASMSGSGSSVFGLFDSEFDQDYLEFLDQDSNYRHFTVHL